MTTYSVYLHTGKKLCIVHCLFYVYVYVSSFGFCWKTLTVALTAAKALTELCSHVDTWYITFISVVSNCKQEYLFTMY